MAEVKKTSDRAAEAVEVAASQTDFDEWKEYEMDMKQLYENLKEEGIDVPVDDQGDPVLTPTFIKSLPPSVQPHAGGKVFTGGKPFKSELNITFKGRLGREIQTRNSIWEDYKKDLKQLYKTLEKNGVKVQKDAEGNPILNEDLLKTLPAEVTPHPAGVEFAPIPGLEALPDGTKLTPRLTMKLLNPALLEELMRRLSAKGILVPMENGKPSITPNFIRSLPVDVLRKVLEPIYDNTNRVTAARKSVIRRLSIEEKKSLANLIEKTGIQIKKVSTDQNEPVIPVSAVMQFTEDEVSEAVGVDNSHNIFEPAPHKIKELPKDIIKSLNNEQREELSNLLRDQGILVDLDFYGIPVITYTEVRLLPKETLKYFGIVIADDDTEDANDKMLPSSSSKTQVRIASLGGAEGAVGVDENVEFADDSKRTSIKLHHKDHEYVKSRLHLSTNRGLFHLSRSKDLKVKLEQRLIDAGIEVILTSEGAIDLTHVPEDIVNDFHAAIQSEITELHVETLHERIMQMAEEDQLLIHAHLEISGIDIPLDDTGKKIITVKLLEELPRDTLINLLASIFASRPSIQEEEEEALEEEIVVQYDDVPDVDFELELTEEQKEEFYEKLIEEGIIIPLDVQTGKPKFTKFLMRNVPRKLAQEIIATATNVEGKKISLNSAISSDDEGSEYKRKTILEDNSHYTGGTILGLRYSCGLGYVTDETGQKINYDGMVKYLEDAYSDKDIQEYDESNSDNVASLKAQIRAERQQEEIDPEIKHAGSFAELQKMAMRFIPDYNLLPEKKDPLFLFDHTNMESYSHHGQDHHDHDIHHPQPPQPQQKTVDFLEVMRPKFFSVGRLDSMAEITSTIGRKLSIETLRGSNISTHLSELPSTYSQPFIDESSMSMMGGFGGATTASTQKFDITRQSAANYRLLWLTQYMSGLTLRQTFAIRIVNMVSRKNTELRVCKFNTLNQVCHLYMQYDKNPEYYVWKDIFGRVLRPEKTLVENGLVRQDEILEFQGYRRLPIILLYFRDGFESDPPLPLNPLHALKQKEPGLCRNY